MVCCCCCCDPHKLAYISGIITAIEAVGFSIINILLICIANCSLTIPPEALSGTLKYFLGWYFYGNTTDCTVEWLPLEGSPLGRVEETSPEANFNYQIAYLVLHVLWFITSLIMIYGNARKRWGYYVPWLLITLALLIMDAVIVSFYGKEIMDIDINAISDLYGIPAMAMIISLYSRGIVFWIMNLTEFGTVLNAFCKSYHKRSKQERQQKKREKKERAQQYHQEASMAGQRAVTTPPAAAPTTGAPKNSAPPRNPLAAPGPSAAYGYPQGDQDFGVYDNAGYMSDHPPVFPEQPPPPPRVPQRVPSELLPFSYLNPGFRPNHPHDVDGMRAGGKTHSELGYMSDEGGPKRPPPYAPSPDGFEGPPYPPPPRHMPPPPEAFQKRHDSLRNLPSFPQNARQARPYSSLRNRPGPGPSQDPRSSGEYADPWDQKQHPSQLEQLSEYLGLSKVFPKGDPSMLLGSTRESDPHAPQTHPLMLPSGSQEALLLYQTPIPFKTHSSHTVPYHPDPMHSHISLQHDHNHTSKSHLLPTRNEGKSVDTATQITRPFPSEQGNPIIKQPGMHIAFQNNHDPSVNVIPREITDAAHHQGNSLSQIPRNTTVPHLGAAQQKIPGEQLVHGGVEVSVFRRNMTARMSDRLRRKRQEKLGDHARSWEVQWQAMKQERVNSNRKDDQKKQEVYFTNNQQSIPCGNKTYTAVQKDPVRINNDMDHVQTVSGQNRIIGNPVYSGPVNVPRSQPHPAIYGQVAHQSTLGTKYQQPVTRKEARHTNNRAPERSGVNSTSRGFLRGRGNSWKRSRKRNPPKAYVQVKPSDEVPRQSRSSSPSVASEDTLPVDPAFPIMFKVPGMRCRREGPIMMHYHPCDGFQCSGGPRAKHFQDSIA